MIRHLILVSALLAASGQMVMTGGSRKIFSSGGGGITLVSAQVLPQTAISSNICTLTLGTTIGTGHFLWVQADTSNNGATALTNVKAYVGGTGGTAYTMTLVGRVDVDTHGATNFLYLDNTAAIDTIQATFSSANGSYCEFLVAEYSGVSTTAAPQAAYIGNGSGFVSVGTWSTGATAYTAVGGGLLLSGAINSSASAGPWGATSPWTLVTSTVTSAHGLQSMLEAQTSYSAGSFTGQGTWGTPSGGLYYESYIVEMK